MVRTIIKVGGISKVVDAGLSTGRLRFADFSPDPFLRLSFWSVMVGYTCQMVLNFGLQQAAVQRYSATRSLRHARLTVLMLLPTNAVFNLVLALLALSVSSYYAVQECDPIVSGHIQSSNGILPYYVRSTCADVTGFAGLFLSMLYSGALSTVSSLLSGTATNTWEDSLKVRLGHLSDYQATMVIRGLVVVYGILSALVALLATVVPGNIYKLTVSSLGYISGPFLGMFLLGGLTKLTEWRGVIVGGVAGLAVNFWIGIGALYYPSAYTPLPPLSSHACANVTMGAWQNQYKTNISLQRPLGVHRIHDISFMYYTPVGMMVTIAIGILVSASLRMLLADIQQVEVQDKYLISWRSFRTFGEDYEQCHGDRDKVNSQALTNDDIPPDMHEMDTQENGSKQEHELPMVHTRM